MTRAHYQRGFSPVAAHGPTLFVPNVSVPHRLAPAPKLVATVLFVIAVALVPQQQVLPVIVNAIVLAVVIFSSRLPWRVVAVRLLVIVPFVFFAFLLPFVGQGERTEVAGIAISIDGAWGAWGVLTKAALGATATIILSSTTSIPDLLRALTTLRVPSMIIAIVSFMFRYLELVISQMHRTRTAMTARAHDPRWFWQIRPIALSAGAIFVRTYERGERVHLAMMARGYSGSMPRVDVPEIRKESRSPSPVLAAVPPALAWLTLSAAIICNRVAAVCEWWPSL